MLVNSIVQDVTEIVGHWMPTVRWKYFFLIMGCCFIGFCFIFCQVSLSHFHPVIIYWAIKDTFSPTVTHRIVRMGQQLVYIVLPQSKFHLQFLSYIPNEKSYLNISGTWWPHILTLLLVFCKGSVLLPAPEWCFNSESHVSTFFEHSLIFFRVQNQDK